MDDIACAVIETRENIFLYFENIFVSSSLIRNERERERGRIDQKYLGGLSICEHHFGISFLKRENELFQ